MDKIAAVKALRDWDQKGRYVFTRRDLRKLFPEDAPKAFAAGINRLVKEDILIKVCRRGVYVNPHASSVDGYAIEHIEKALRRCANAGQQ